MLPALPKVLYLQEPYRWLYEALPRLAWVGEPRIESPWTSPKAAKRSVRECVRIQALQLQASEERSNAATFDRILVNSFFSRESVLRAYGLDAEVCYLGVSTDGFRPAEVQRERFVVGLGSFGFEKGIDTAIRAVAAIPKQKRPNLVWIANTASHPYYEQMMSLAASL